MKTQFQRIVMRKWWTTKKVNVWWFAREVTEAMLVVNNKSIYRVVRSWARFNFHANERPVMHSLFFLYANVNFTLTYARKNYSILEINRKYDWHQQEYFFGTVSMVKWSELKSQVRPSQSVGSPHPWRTTLKSLLCKSQITSEVWWIKQTFEVATCQI